jgi:hypothetical protein
MLRLADAAQGQCDNGWRHPGLTTHHVRNYPRALRRQVRGFAGRAPTVLRVSDPELARQIRPGDTLVGLDGRAVAATDIGLQPQLALGRMTVARGGQKIDIRTSRPRLCYRPVRVTRSQGVEARTTVDAVEISQGLISFSQNDSELAYALAHELSHFMLGHPQILADARRDGELGPSLRRALETEADRGAVYLMHRTGFASTAALSFMGRTSGLRDIPLFGLSSHPTRQTRMRDVRRAIDAVGTSRSDTIAAFVAEGRAEKKR